MINLSIFLIFVSICVYTMVRCIMIFLKEPYRPDARYLCGWSVSTVVAMSFIVLEMVYFGESALLQPGIPPFLRVTFHVFLNTGVLAIIYYGVAVSVGLTGEQTQKRKRCRRFLGVTLLTMTVADVVYQLVGIAAFYWVYAAAFVPAGIGYTVKIIYWYHTHAQTAAPITRWRMRTSKWGCIFCLCSVIDLFIPSATWVVRPSAILCTLAWTLFSLSPSIPFWLRRRIVGVEIAPQLFNDALFLWGYITLRYQPIANLKPQSSGRVFVGPAGLWGRVAFWFKGGLELLDKALFLFGCVIDCYDQLVSADKGRLEKWIKQWSQGFPLLPEQTEILVRAAYLSVGWFWVKREKRPILKEDSQLTISGDVLMKEGSSESALEIRRWQQVAVVLRHTAERWDGKGSPQGLALLRKAQAGSAQINQREEIPIESRLLAFYSEFVREWQVAGDTEASVARLMEGAGTRFDPTLVARFAVLVSRLELE